MLQHLRSYDPSRGDPPKGFACEVEVSLASVNVPRNVGVGHGGPSRQLTGVESEPPWPSSREVCGVFWFWEPRRPRRARRARRHSEARPCKTGRSCMTQGVALPWLYPWFCQFIPSPPFSHHLLLVFAASYRFGSGRLQSQIECIVDGLQFSRRFLDVQFQTLLSGDFGRCAL